MHRFLCFSFLVVAALSLIPAASALPVFPGAVGFGSHTVAGRRGQVYRVTNLNDSGPGSLRFGVQEIRGPRVIVFEVSGVIELKSDLAVRSADRGDYGFLTIAGQTAPPPGITLKNAGIAVHNHDVLIQHLAIRPGTSTEFPTLPRFGNRDAIKVEATPGQAIYNIVIDHVSCSWALDETVSTWSDEGSIYNVTFLDCIFAEGIRHVGDKSPAGYGPLGGRNTLGVSFIGNLMAFNHHRNPLIRDAIGNVEILNNLIYRPHPSHHGAIYFGSAAPALPKLTLIASAAGNVVIRAPSGELEGHRYPVSTLAVWVHEKATTRLSLYLANNSVFNPDTNTWYPTDGNPFSKEVYQHGPIAPGQWTSNPFPANGAEVWTEGPEEREAKVLATAGKQPAFRDAIDAALIEKVRQRTGTWVLREEDLGPKPWQPADVRQTRPLVLPANPDADDDNDGYTNLEEWLHGWSAYVEGRAAEPPRADAQPEKHLNYQSPGVVANLPVFYQRVADRVTHPMSWTSGAYKDFDAWKKLARQRVQQSWLTPPPTAPWDVAVLGEEDRGSYVVRKLALNISGDSRVLAYLTVPKGAGPFPAVLVLHDHGGRFDIGKEKMVRPFAVPDAVLKSSEEWTGRAYGGRYVADELSKRGYVCFVTDALNWGDRGGGGDRGQQAIASNLMHLGMSFAGLMAWEDLRAAEFLASLPEVDHARIGAMGHSMGAYRTWQVTAMSPHIAAGVAICWMGTVKSLIVPGNNQARGDPAFSMLHPGLLADLDYPDIASLACPKPVLFYNGLYDRLFPQFGVHEAYEKMHRVWDSQGASDRLATRIWKVEHTFNQEMQEAAFAWLDSVLKK